MNDFDRFAHDPRFEVAIKMNCKRYTLHKNEPPENDRPEALLQYTYYELYTKVDLSVIMKWARAEQYYLCTIFINDEINSDAGTFSMNYIFSGGIPATITGVKYLFDPKEGALPSATTLYPNAESLEQEYDLFLKEDWNREQFGPPKVLLRKPPKGLAPMRQDRYSELIKHLIPKYYHLLEPYLDNLAAGRTTVVGDIHAQIIGGGLFLFTTDGEIIETVSIVLGEQFRGIEKLFETKSLLSGWSLAECVAGESSFAHSMAYCQAVEALAQIRPPKPAVYWRALFLELERISNHIGNVAALYQDISVDSLCSRLLNLQEAIYQLNEKLTDNMLLRGVNRPGGIILNRGKRDFPPLNEIHERVAEITYRFLLLCEAGLNNRGCQKRFSHTGIVTRQQANEQGATGIIARSSGEVGHDFRILHRSGVYQENERIKEILNSRWSSGSQKEFKKKIYLEDLIGDANARLLLRIAEVESSSKIIGEIAATLESFGEKSKLMNARIGTALEAKKAYVDFGLGLVEGWGGDVVYWIMKGPDNGIARCSLRDPAAYNFPVMQLAVDRNASTGNENILADFPIINKSFNNSYSGYAK